MSYRNVSGRLASVVANGATFLAAYPHGTDAGTFYGGVEHSVSIAGSVSIVPDSFALSFGASGITVTNNTGAALGAGTEYSITLDIAGKEVPDLKRAAQSENMWVVIGAPIALDADGVCASQKPAAAGALTINGALKPAGTGAAVFDVPRAVSVASDGVDTARAFVVSGFDEYDQPMSETITGVNAATVTGKKAFKRVTRVTVDAATAGNITVGSSDVLGLPTYLGDAAFVLREMENTTVRTNGTFVVGATAKPSATSGDVRGTYKPNAATNGALAFRLLIATPTPAYKGRTQYAG